MPSTTEMEFNARDLIGSAGVGANGEKLVNTLLDYYPPELQAAQLKRINESLTAELDDDAYASVARIAGVDEVAHVVVVGGEQRGDQAMVRYAFLADDGTVCKGAFPHSDLGQSSSDGHVSQRNSLAAGTAAAEARRTREYAGDPVQATASQESAVDPFEALEGLSAPDTVKLMEANPERAEAIKAFEEATRGEKARKSVLEWEPEPDDSGDGASD